MGPTVKGLICFSSQGGRKSAPKKPLLLPKGPYGPGKVVGLILHRGSKGLMLHSFFEETIKNFFKVVGGP
jgi:hypothetical protein